MPNISKAGGGELPQDYENLDPSSGQQKAYVVLSKEERLKGFTRPYRDSYTHTTCGSVTRMGRDIAETYARDPKFYSGTFCSKCKKHFSLCEFKWVDTDITVGT